MRLQTKINLLLLGAFLVGLALSAWWIWLDAQKNAKEEVEHQARLILASAQAIREYTAREIVPLVNAEKDNQFHPQMVSAYAAQAYFKAIREHDQNFSSYAYKEASLNPTNRAHLATQWEADIINTFRNDKSLQELIVWRQSALGQFLTLAHPIRVSDPSCLNCHGRVSDAPRDMLAVYGPNNGFGWGMDAVVAAQFISVPVSLPMQRAKHIFLTSLGAITGVFLVTVILLNVVLQALVMRPIQRISEMASEVSLGNLDVPNYQWPTQDEIGSLSHSFNRMRRSVELAQRILSREESTTELLQRNSVEKYQQQNR